jgi:hypothetical protein
LAFAGRPDGIALIDEAIEITGDANRLYPESRCSEVTCS